MWKLNSLLFEKCSCCFPKRSDQFKLLPGVNESPPPQYSSPFFVLSFVMLSLSVVWGNILLIFFNLHFLIIIDAKPVFLNLFHIFLEAVLVHLCFPFLMRWIFFLEFICALYSLAFCKKDGGKIFPPSLQLFFLSLYFCSAEVF